MRPALQIGWHVTAVRTDATDTMAIADAEAAHKVSIERCESHQGDARTERKKNACVELTDAKARADTAETAAYPNGSIVAGVPQVGAHAQSTRRSLQR